MDSLNERIEERYKQLASKRKYILKSIAYYSNFIITSLMMGMWFAGALSPEVPIPTELRWMTFGILVTNVLGWIRINVDKPNNKK